MCIGTPVVRRPAPPAPLVAVGVPVKAAGGDDNRVEHEDATATAERYFVHAWSAWNAYYATRELKESLGYTTKVMTYARALSFWMTMAAEARAYVVNMDAPSTNEAALAAMMAGAGGLAQVRAVQAARLRLADSRRLGLLEHIKSSCDHATRIAIHRECKLVFSS